MGIGMMGKRGVIGLLLAGAALLPLGAQAQDVRDLDRESSNVRVFQGTVADGPALFETNVAAGGALRIDVVTTSDLDPTVTVTDAATGEELARDDDSGGELNSRVTIRGGERGRRIRISVQAFNFDALSEVEAAADAAAAAAEYAGEEYALDGGSFDLRLTALAFTPQTVRSIGWNSAVGGSLIGDEAHEYSFTGEPGQVIDVVMLAGEDSGLDPYLELRDAKGEVVASNDDGGDSLNARLRHVMRDGGTYTIVAKAYGSSSGDYTLRVGERREAVEQAALQVIGFGGDAMGGTLGEGAENGGIDPQWIDYRLSEEAIASIMAGGGQVTIRMTKADDSDPTFGNALDPYLELGFDTPLGFAAVDSDDDSGGDLNAMLPVDLSSLAASADLLGHLRIRAKAFSGSGGAYAIVITEGMVPRPVYDEYEGLDIVVPPPAPVRIAPAYD